MRIPKFRCHVKEDNGIHEVDQIDFMDRQVVVYILKSQGTTMVPMRFRFTFDEVDLLEGTGLLDTNEKEGYHKDITLDEEVDAQYVVEWKDGVFYLRGIGKDCFDQTPDDLEITVLKKQRIIGTIFDIPASEAKDDEGGKG